MRFATIIRAAVAVLVIISPLACDSSSLVLQVGEGIDTLSVEVLDERSILVQTLNLEVAQTAQLHAIGENLFTEFPVSPVWSSSRPLIASVSDSGLVTALTPGTTNIRASVADLTATIPTVVADTAVSDSSGPPPPDEPTEVHVVASPGTLRFGSLNQTLSISVGAEDGAGEPLDGIEFAFTSSNSAVAEVDAMGRVTSRALGTAVIAVTAVCCKAGSDSITVADSVGIQVVDGTSSPAGVLFHSDWSTATGTSSTALLDLSKDFPWDSEKGDSNGGAAVTDTVDWPDGIEHGLSIAHISGNDNPGVRLDGSLPEFAPNTSRYWRVYIKVVAPSEPRPYAYLGDDGSHPIQDGAGGSNTNWEIDIEMTSSDVWRPQFDLTGNTEWGINGFPGDQLNRDQVYRLEWGLERNNSNQLNFLGMRIYNAAGDLVYDENDLRRQSDSEPATTVHWYPLINPGTTTDQQLGINGMGGGSTSSPYVLWHYAAFAICEGDWCGPYRDGI